MGLMDEMMQERFGPPIKCSVYKTAQLLEEADKADFMKAIEENLIPATVISKVLARREIMLKETAIQHHRRKDCGCRK